MAEIKDLNISFKSLKSNVRVTKTVDNNLK